MAFPYRDTQFDADSSGHTVVCCAHEHAFSTGKVVLNVEEELVESKIDLLLLECNEVFIKRRGQRRLLGGIAERSAA